ncbi:MAG: Coenzyme F420 hydrogenase/dehydrogenase, beta subunit C-terminal domain, partial [Clostridia bacterium]|nr:Coenzyme F420 hydrogenase/dehydrogenase, beta subunit C-terminal domain [Clostridia bacterium]
PCQIASLDRYLKIIKKRDKFLLIDFICHGVPSYLLWERYISSCQKFDIIVLIS